MDYQEIFNETMTFLSESGYSFIEKQIHEELRTGKLLEERIKTLKESSMTEFSTSYLFNETTYRRGQPADFIRRQDYSDEEALILLLEASKRAVIDSAVMVADIHNNLKEFNFSEVILIPEPEGFISSEEDIILTDKINADEAKERAIKINDIIKKIRD
ncbi:hypothetical protein H5A34_10525 [Pectobacterium brasiliense]|uniref:hypothetical protein n=1 Tax=Pectobacterium brasiliense TaxID=180957 RepID=UPI00196919E5|nr:hypothetical protein [Pectobacterium brasiliense]MBN3068539.1 hypothetical protein [Pectobacterium brasiliense]MBN3246597.1 hypothetical protein [Pectobacterium brasiliense]